MHLGCSQHHQAPETGLLVKEASRARRAQRSRQSGSSADGSKEGCRNAEELLRATFESLDAAVFVVEAATRTVVDCNPAVGRLFGYRREEVIGRNTAFLHLDQAAYEQFGRDLFPALDAHGVYRTEYRVRRKNGEVFPSEHCVTQVLDARGRRTHLVSVVRDVTEHRQAAEKIREAEERFRSLYENAVDAILLTAPDGRILNANAAACRMLGRTEEEIREVGRAGLVDPCDDRVPALLAERARTGKAQGEITYVRKDGTRFPGYVTSGVFTDAHGQARTAMIIHDLSARKMVEDALRRSEARYREVVNDQTEVISRFLEDGTFTFVNDVYCRFFGKSPSDLIGRKWQPVTLPEDLPHIEARLRLLSPARPVITIENRVYSGNGDVRWMQFVNRGFFDAQGRLHEIQSVGRDITERKRAEKRAETERRRFYEVLEELPVMICLLTPDYRVPFANRRFREKFGESHGRRCYEYCFHRSAPCEFCQSFTVLKTGQPHCWEAVCPDGTVIEAYDLPFRDVDGSLMVLEMDLDVTERKQTEARLERRTRELRLLHGRMAEVQERERENLARDLHDTIGTELSAIGLTLGVARLRAGKGEADSIPDTLAHAERQVEQVIRSVRHFIAELRPGILEDYGLIAAVRAIADRTAERTGMTIEVEGPEDVRFAKETETALYRIVQEAMANVVKHAKATRVRLSLRQSADGIRLSIRDDGRGFDPEESRGATPSGGIGLIGMRERAAAIGARFSVTSGPGKGTEVVVEVCP